MAEAKREGVTLFGAGSFARAVCKALIELKISVRAFVVSESSIDRIDGVPVVALCDLNDSLRSLPMWLAVFNHRPESDFGKIYATCLAGGVSRFYFPTMYFELIAQSVGWRYWLTDRRDYGNCREQIMRAFEMFSDDDSRLQFKNTLNFRLGISGYEAPAPCNEPQYFLSDLLACKRLNLNEGMVLVDGGAYDGDTIEEAARSMKLNRAYGFEPDLKNFCSLVKNASSFSFPIICYPCALSQTAELVSFESDQGEASTIGASGASMIQCVSLDECLIGERIDYIKLDIEGHEISALHGARSIIARDRPVLAIAAYHRWDDIWRIPELICSIVPEYRIFYRVHEYNTFDAVFYAH